MLETLVISRTNPVVSPIGDYEYPGSSADGRYVAFNSYNDAIIPGDTNGKHDTRTGTTRRVSETIAGEQSDGNSNDTPAFSDDGRYVIFESWATNLVPEDDNSDLGVFVASVQEVAVSSVFPDNLPIGATTSVVITGVDFLPGSRVSVMGAVVSNFEVIDENTIHADITVAAGAPAGTGTVTVRLPGTGPGALKGSYGFCVDCMAFF